MELSQLISDFSSVLSEQHKKLLVIGASVALYLAIAFLGPRLMGKKDNVLDFLRPYLKGKSSYLKGNTLNIDVWAKKAFMDKIAWGIALLSFIIFYEFPNDFTTVILFLLPIGVGIYGEIPVPTPGIYKNGKYLGTVYTGFIKVGNSFALGKRRGTKTIGYLKILKNGWVVAELHLTPEGFMELKPEKIHEVFPEIKGNIEKFKNLYKVGDYTLEYKFFQKTANATSYQGVANTSSLFDDESIRSDYTTDPAYSSLPGNIYYHDTFHH